MATIEFYESSSDVRPSALNAKELLFVTDTIVNNLKTSQISRTVSGCSDRSNLNSSQELLVENSKESVNIKHRSFESSSSEHTKSHKSYNQPLSVAFSADKPNGISEIVDQEHPHKNTTDSIKNTNELKCAKNEIISNVASSKLLSGRKNVFESAIISPLSRSPEPNDSKQKTVLKYPTTLDNNENSNNSEKIQQFPMLDSGYQTTNFTALLRSDKIEEYNENNNTSTMFVSNHMDGNLLYF